MDQPTIHLELQATAKCPLHTRLSKRSTPLASIEALEVSLVEPEMCLVCLTPGGLIDALHSAIDLTSDFAEWHSALLLDLGNVEFGDGKLLDVVLVEEELLKVGQDENTTTFLTCTSGTSETMNVLLEVARQTNLQHKRNTRNVDTTCSDV